MAARVSIEDPEGQVISKAGKVGREQNGSNTRIETQNNQTTPPKQTHLQTTETERKQQKALAPINRAQWLEGINNGGPEKDAQSDNDTEMGTTQTYNTTDTGTDDEKKSEGKEDEEFEAAMNKAIDDSNHEYNSRTAATFKTSIQAPGGQESFCATWTPDNSTGLLYHVRQPSPYFGVWAANSNNGKPRKAFDAGLCDGEAPKEWCHVLGAQEHVSCRTYQPTATGAAEYLRTRVVWYSRSDHRPQTEEASHSASPG
ncbi:hypothetical protein ColTof4_09934 [Colletotrichum tofieldiae]|nr:hypothetical protein ColTof3_05294 [Colletotrichum tofieldiae]GKT77511.1 hypothetical protein ColTof4_09934 [Colletotrichum tofieldiae]